MKLYRFAGSAELFQACGKLPIKHTVSGNLTELKKYSNKWRAEARKTGLEHRVYIEIIHIDTLNQAILAKALSFEDTELLIKLSSKLKEWEWKRGQD